MVKTLAAPLSQILTDQGRPWCRPLLALALAAAITTAAPAQMVPPHLVSMSSDLLRAMKEQLQTPPRDVGPPQVVKRTNDLLEQEMLYRWGRGRLAQADVVPKIASTLGVARVTPENLPTLQRFLDTWSQGETDQALREFYQATGRRPPSATEREALSQKLSEVLRADPATSARPHTIQGRNRGQSVTLEWQPEKFRFSMRVEDDGSGGTEPFRTTIAGDIKPKISQNRQDLELSVKPAAHPLHAQDAKELRQACTLLFGQWQDGEGRIWQINPADRRASKELARVPPSPPLPEPKAGGLVTVIHLTKTRKDGSIQDWPEARCQGGRLQARGVFNDIRDMKPDLPEQVKKQLLSWSAPRWIDLSLHYDPATGEMRLEGDSWAEHVTYSADDYRIKRIHTPYAKPLALARTSIKKEDFHIVRVEVDTWKWQSRLSDLKNEIAKNEPNLKWHKEKRDEAHSRFHRLDQQRDQVEDRMEAAAKAVAALEARLKGPPALPDKPSPDLQRRLDTKAMLEREIEGLDAEIIELGEKRPPSWWEQIARKDQISKDYRQQLERIERLIQEEYAKLKFDPKQKQEEMQKQLKPLQDQYWSLRKEKAILNSNVSSVSNEIMYYQEHINKLEEKLTDLNQKLKELDEHDTPFVDRVLVYDSSGKEMGCWEAWAPFEAIQRIQEDTDRLGKLLKELKKQKDESYARFREAAEEASRALDQVAQAIWSSAWRQAAIETGYYAYDVFGKGWKKGGPFGALTEALGKAAEAYVMGGGAIKFKEADPKAIEKRMEEQYGLKPGIFADTVEKLDNIAAKRVLKDTIFRETKKQANQRLMAPLTQTFLVDHMTDQLIRGMEKGSPVTVNELERRCKKLVNYNDNLKNLKKTKPYQLRNFVQGFFKDVSKDLLKDMAKLEEVNAWEPFFEKDIWARLCFAGFQETNQLYWDTYDQYMAWQALRDALVKGYDPKSGFMAKKTALLKDGEHYAIQLELQNPRGKQEKVWVGIREARLAGDHKFSIQAKDLKPSNEKGDVVLKIEVQ